MPQPLSWLCSICKQVIEPEASGPTLRFETPSGQTWEIFRKAAADNCFICSKVWNLSEQHRKAWDCLGPEAWTSLRYMVDREVDQGEVHVIKLFVIFQDPTREQSEQATDVRFRLIPTIGSEYETLFPLFDAKANTGSSTTLDLAYSWFHECTCHHHDSCKSLPILTKGWLPSRLLDVGSYQDTHWKLIFSKTDFTRPLTPIYLTLSYRWGTNPQHALLTSSTMDQYRRGSPITRLPQTFQDFIFLARRFGVRYVWIDCFCIIQDSQDDWDAEAPMMRQIYANAVCNIAASASDSPEGGLFQTRNVQDIRPGIISTTLSSELPQRFYIFDKSYWDRQLLVGPLHRRGWVFQERFLGPRQLYFAKNQVLWECLEVHKCEGFPRGIPLHESSKSIKGLLDLPATRITPEEQLKHDDQGPPKEMSFEAVSLWCSLVTSYTRCHFTKPEDKLCAFSGIAKLFKEVTGDRYLAGSWRSQILHLLNWTVFNPKPKPLGRYRAPSWSWASLDGPVKMHKPAAGFELLASVLDVRVTNKNEDDDTVDVISACIKLRAPFVTAEYTRDSAGGPLQVQLRDQSLPPFIVWPFPDTTEAQFGSAGTICFILLKSQVVYYHNQHNGGERADLTCLVLAPLEKLAGEYSRAGWFLMGSEDVDIEALKAQGKRELILV